MHRAVAKKKILAQEIGQNSLKIPPPPHHFSNGPSLSLILQLILQENSFEFNDKNYLQIHGTAMRTKVAVAFANIFMPSVETEIISQSNTKPLEWKRYTDDTEKFLNAVTKLCVNLGSKRILGE